MLHAYVFVHVGVCVNAALISSILINKSKCPGYFILKYCWSIFCKVIIIQSVYSLYKVYKLRRMKEAYYIWSWCWLEWLNKECPKKSHQNKSDILPEILQLPSGSTAFSWELAFLLSIATTLFLTRSSCCWKNCSMLLKKVEIKVNDKTDVSVSVNFW